MPIAAHVCNLKQLQGKTRANRWHGTLSLLAFKEFNLPEALLGLRGGFVRTTEILTLA